MKNHLISFFLYLLGCMAPTLALIEHFSLLDMKMISVVILLISAAVYLLMRLKKRRMIFLILFLLLGGFIMVNLEPLKTGLFYIYNQTVSVYTKYTGLNFEKIGNYTNFAPLKSKAFLLLLILHFISSTIMALLFEKKKNFLIFLFSLILMLPSLIFQIKLNWWIMTGVFAFWVMLFVPFGGGFSWKARLHQLLLIAVSVCLCCFAFIHFLSEAQFKEIYHPITVHEELVNRFNSLITYISTLQMKNDRLDLNTAGNRYYTGVVHLKVHRTQREELYLKYYSGAVYEDNSWRELNSEIYNRLKERDYEYSFTWIDSYENGLGHTEKITVEDLRSGNVYAPLPYFLQHIKENYVIHYDVYMTLENKNAPVTYQIRDADMIQENKIRSYNQFVFMNYLDVPDSVEQLFRDELNMDKTILTLEAAQSKILSILKDYTYTLSPGSMPLNKDFLEYFLLENKRGYCVHFATAATLMFRYYGIPARYAEGYHVNATQFDSNMDASVPDSGAHAWVEVFDSAYGWIPIEVTVSNSSTNTPAGNEPQLPQNPSTGNNQPQINRPEQPDDPSSTVIDNGPTGNDNHIEETDEIKIPPIFIALGAMMALVLIYAFMRVLIIRNRLQKCMQQNRQKAVFEIYHYLNRIERYEKVLQDEVISLFEKNRYSKEGLAEPEYRALMKYAMDCAKAVYFKLPWYQKFVYKYVKCLL